MANLITLKDYEKIKNQEFSAIFFDNGRRLQTVTGSIIRIVNAIQLQTKINPLVTTYIFNLKDIMSKNIDINNSDQQYFAPFL